MQHRRPENNRFDERLVRVETSIENLVTTVHDYVRKQDDRDRSISTQMDGIQSDFSKSRQANWPILMSVASVFLVLAGLMGGVVAFSNIAALAPLKVAIENNTTRLVSDHHQLSWIPSVRVRLDFLERLVLPRLGYEVQRSNQQQ